MFANTLVASLLLSLLLASTTGGSSSNSRRGVSVTATEMLQVGAATSSDVSSVEADDEDSKNNEGDGPISGGGFVVVEAQPKEQKPAPLSTNDSSP